MTHSDLTRSKPFRLHFKLTTPPDSLHRFSLLLKLRRWRLRFESEPKSRLVQIFNKLRNRPHFGFQVKLSATSLHLLLKLRKWGIRVKSEPGSSGIKSEVYKRKGSVKSRFVRFFKKIQSRIGINERIDPKEARFVVGGSRLVKCGAFLVIAMAGVVFGFDVTKVVQFAMDM